MEIEDVRGSHASPASDNACSLMGYESYFSDFHEESELKLCIQSSCHGDKYSNVVGNKDFENKEESNGNALDHVNLFEVQGSFIKEDLKTVDEEAMRIIAEDDQDDFPGLSPLRGDCVTRSSNIGNRVEAEYLMFDDGRDCNGCDNFLFSSRVDVHVPLVGADGDISRQKDGFYCSPPTSKCLHASKISYGSSVDMKIRNLSNVESQRSNFDCCSGNAANLADRTTKDRRLLRLQDRSSLLLQHSSMMKETYQFNNFVCVPEIQNADEEILGVPHNEQTNFSAMERTISEKHSRPSSFACCSIGAADFERNNFDSFNRMSTPFNNNECCMEAKTAVGALANSSSIEIVRRTNPKRSASLRSSLDDRKSNLLNPILQRDGRKHRRKIKASASCALITPMMFVNIKRKIRNSHRQARVSLWGRMECLLTNFKRREDPIKHDIESIAVKKRRSKIAGPVANRRKRTSALKNKLSGLLFNKIPFSSSQSIPPVLPDAETFLKISVEQSMAHSDGHIASETSSTKFIIKQNSLEKWYTVSSNARGGQQGERDMDSTLTQETSADNLLSECHGVSSRVKLNFVAETVDDKQPLNSGSSPDSDIYHPKEKDGLPCAEGPFTELSVDSLPLLEKQVQQCENPRWNCKILQNQTKKVKETRDKKGKKEKKCNKKGQVNEHSFILSDSYCAEESLDCEGKLNEVKIDSLCCNCCFKDKGTCDKGGKCQNSVRKHCKKGTKSEMFLTHSSVSGTSYFGNSNNRIEIQSKMEGTKFHLLNDDKEQLEALLPSDYVNERQMHPSTIKSLSKSKSGRSFSIKQRKKIIYGRHKGSIRKSNKVRKDNVVPKENESLGFSLETVCETAVIDTLTKDVSNNVTTSDFSELSAIEMHKVLLKQSSLSGKLAWALCDDCQKWRCVPDELVNVIEKSRWTCKDNADEAFADCTIPQEKTDDDINQDLGIFNEDYYSTELHSHGKLAPLGLSAASQTMWTRIKSNLFLHRNRRTLNIDEIMVCHCKSPLNGSLGCGEECLNRMLNIECVKGTCPCGSLCSNQQFQKRKYIKFKWIKCGKKGYGLQLEENVSRGKFLIEYVGEVLDIPTYEARLRHYASRGQKHFYFMTLNGGEVIDACTKGNLGRYVNHSCDPNCRTEKWMVNGEVCIGLFAIRDIKKGEEITFDYNYVRVFGAAAKKCVCGSAECRGYIGGDPSSSEVIVQDDSDAEDLEPVMIDEDGNVELGVAGSDSIATDAKVANHESLERNDTKWTPTMSEQGVCVENHAAIFSGSSELDLTNSLMQSLDSAESKNNLYRISEVSPLQELSLSIESDQNFCEVTNESPPLSPAFVPLPPGQLSERSEHSLNTSLQSDRTVHEQVMDNAARISSENFDPFMHRSSSAAFDAVKAVGHLKIKRCRVNIRSAASGKTKKVSAAISTRHIEGVEEMLNELLDEDGGILRQKDAAKGYLKLLVVTAAAGDETRGSMSQSVRNLSLILDAILKTKSRMVLVDIINKNGLQMLHNMMKQNRENFNRIPILRKLLKVLEFLAEKEILTRDHIYATPPCCGMESFKESMLKLMKHRDSQVQLIARNFADQWIPRNIVRRTEPFDNHSRHNWCPSQQVSTSASFSENNSRTTEITESRKRKTRWDHPADKSHIPDQDIMLAGIQTLVEPISDARVSKCVDEDGEDDEDDEMPPGFESPFVDECPPTTCVNAPPPEVAIGHPQERYLRHLPVSYGVPIDLMLHLGTPVSKIEIGDRINPSWRVAPAMPFMPFPPLPPYPRSEPCPPFANGFHEKTFHCGGGRGRFYPKQSSNGRRFFRPPCQGDRRCGSRWT